MNTYRKYITSLTLILTLLGAGPIKQIGDEPFDSQTQAVDQESIWIDYAPLKTGTKNPFVTWISARKH